MERTRVFVTEHSPDYRSLFLVTTYFGKPDLDSTLFLERMPEDFGYRTFEFIDAPETAEYFLYPHPIYPGGQEAPHFLAAKEQARIAGKPLIVFGGGDLSYDLRIDDVILLKGSQYAYQARKNEIIMSHWVEDLGRKPLAVRSKSARPIVSFCGWVAPSGFIARSKYFLRIALINLRSLIPGQHHVVVRKKGLWWRQYALGLLRNAPGIETRFIERSTFSGSAHTISLDPATARKEYIDNMYNADFVLAPKGDANISLRFYEALSMGRIPILIDTEVVLPLEELIDYNECIVRVPYTQVHQIAEIVTTFHKNLTDERFAEMQHRAREVFSQYLRYDAFFNTLFSSNLLSQAAAARE